MPSRTLRSSSTRLRWQQGLTAFALAWQGTSLAQGAPTLSTEVATAGYRARQLAANLRGDVVVVLGDETQGSRHHAILGWVLRSPGELMGLPDGLRQLDQQDVDCAASSRTIWRSEAFRAQDTDSAPSRVLSLAPESRRPQAFAELSASLPLMAAALRTLCAGGGSVIQAAPAPPAPAAVAAGPAPSPAAPDPSRAGAAPAGPGPGPAPGIGNSIVDQPAFPDTVFSVRSLARLTDSTYASTTRRDAEAAAVRVLVGVLHQLNLRSEAGYQPHQKDHLSFKLTVTQMALDESRRKLAQFQQQLDDRQALLSELQLAQQDLPSVAHKAPDSFKAELYRHGPSGQYLLAFRGTDETADWISNAWLGVDLMKFISPHYQAADELVTALQRKGIQPITVGHSLGGGMAQYVAYRHQLRVVAFNASPVPQRYLSGNSYEASRARLFTALELPRQPVDPGNGHDGRVGDPLSLQVDHLRKLSPTLSGWIKASHQLVKPVCLLTLPDPYFLPEEDADLADSVAMNFVQGPMQTLVHVTRGDVGKKLVVSVAAYAGIDWLLQDPAWNEVAGRDQQAGIEAQKRALKVAVRQARNLAAMGKALGTLANVARGTHMGRTAVDVSAGIMDMVTTTAIKRMLQVHGMARFVRGLGATGDLSPYDLGPDGSTPCAQVESTL
jgi:pimeloyl-ACP methyl ester carboxylesterase